MLRTLTTLQICIMTIAMIILTMTILKISINVETAASPYPVVVTILQEICSVIIHTRIVGRYLLTRISLAPTHVSLSLKKCVGE